MRLHSKLALQKKISIALKQINDNEISYLKRETIPFENGKEFHDFHHSYAYDLDIFDEHSLFQNLNRTATFIGKKTLAKQLLTLLPNKEIISNQEAIKEYPKNCIGVRSFWLQPKLVRIIKTLMKH